MTIDEIYLSIGEEITSAIIEESWEEAQLHFKVVGDGVVGYTGEYFDQYNNPKDIDVFSINPDIHDWLCELHELTTEGGNNRWNRATFTLFPDGEFDMEFQWDQDLDDEIKSLS